MPSKNAPNNATVVDKSTQRLTALKAYVKNPKTEISINGVQHKLNDVIAIYQTSLDTRAALATKRSEVKAAINDRAEAEEARREADRALKYWVINQFGVTSQQATDFGFPPPKAASRTVEDKTHAVLQAKATRVARNTMGKREKLKVKGVIPTSSAPAAPTSTVPPATPGISTPTMTVVAHVTPSQASPVAPVASGVTPAANGASSVPSGPAPIATGTAPVTNGAVVS